MPCWPCSTQNSSSTSRPRSATRAHTTATRATWRGLSGWLEAWDEFTIELEEVEGIGDRHVVCAARQSARGKGSGVEVEMRLGYMFEFRGDRVIRLHILDDREVALAAVSEHVRSG